MKLFKILSALVGVFLLITGEMIRETEIIPKNAQIDVFPAQKVWLPHHKSVSDYLLSRNENKDELIKKLDLMSNLTSSTYEEVRSGKYQAFKLPSDFGNDEDYRIGYNQSLLWSWIFGKQHRWNTDGSWNY